MSRQARSATDLNAEANQIEKSLEKLSGKKRFKAMKKMHMLRFLARKRKNKSVKATTVDPKQGILPGFTDLVAPRTEELARQLIFQALQAQIDTQMANIVELFKKKA